MRRRYGQQLRLGVAADGLALVQCGRAGIQVLAQQQLDALTPEALSLALAELFSRHSVKGWPLSVVLGNELVHLFDVQPPAGSSRFSDLEAAAALRLQSLYGASSHEWRIAADWHARQRFLAAAMPVSLFSQIEQAASTQRCLLVQVVPLFVAALNRWRRARRLDAWFIHLHATTLTLAVTNGAHLVALRSAQLPARFDASWLGALLEREALRLGVSLPAQLQLADFGAQRLAPDVDVAGVRCQWLDEAALPVQSALVALACAGSGA